MNKLLPSLHQVDSSSCLVLGTPEDDGYMQYLIGMFWICNPHQNEDSLEAFLPVSVPWGLIEYKMNP